MTSGERRFLAAWLVLGCGTVPASAQLPAADPIARARAARDVADQKASGEVTRAMADADTTARVSGTAKAVERLKQVIVGLDLSVELSSAKRTELVAAVEKKIEELQKPQAVAADPNGAKPKAAAREAMAAAAAEARAVADGLSKAAKLNDRGQTLEARTVVAGLQKQYPSNPSLQAAQSQDFFRSGIQAEKEYAARYADAWTKNMRSVAASGIPAVADIEFPDKKTWDTLTKYRTAPAVKLTPKEESILKSLDTAVTVNFRGRPFEEALQELSNAVNQPIHIDKKSLEDAGLEMNRPITFAGSISARTALRAVLQAQGLTFVVKDEMIQVMTLEKAQQTLVTRSYYLGDLVAGTGPFGNAVQWGPIASYQQTAENAKIIVDAITNSIDPLAWKTDRGNGPCTVAFNLATLSIVVRASAEVHASLGNSLSGPPKK